MRQSLVVDASMIQHLQRNVLAIHIAPNHNIPKFHLVASQRARLICQNILNLSQLLVDTHIVTL
jgi:hypothetical protein